MDGRDRFLYWWPVTARLVGVGIVVYEMAFAHAPDAQVLAVAGGLMIAPNIFRSNGD